MQGLIVRFCWPWFNHWTELCQSGKRNNHILRSFSLDLDEEALAFGVGVWFDRQVHFHCPLLSATTR
jgi:hypothetical protein